MSESQKNSLYIIVTLNTCTCTCTCTWHLHKYVHVCLHAYMYCTVMQYNYMYVTVCGGCNVLPYCIPQTKEERHMSKDFAASPLPRGLCHRPPYRLSPLGRTCHQSLRLLHHHHYPPNKDILCHKNPPSLPGNLSRTPTPRPQLQVGSVVCMRLLSDIQVMYMYLPLSLTPSLSLSRGGGRSKTETGTHIQLYMYIHDILIHA